MTQPGHARGKGPARWRLALAAAGLLASGTVVFGQDAAAPQPPPATTAAPQATPQLTTPAPAGLAPPAAPLQVGDVVQLKSGSPDMTVIAVGETVQVIWYVEQDRSFKTASFIALALEKQEDDEEDDDEDDDEE
jgi:uncharacterized protein YodC (DUF2158 family)